MRRGRLHAYVHESGGPHISSLFHHQRARVCIGLAALCALAPNIGAQSASAERLLPRRWALSLDGGAESVARRDDAESPLRFSGTGVRGTLRITRESARSLWHDGLVAATARIASDAATSFSQFSSAVVSVDAMRRVTTMRQARVHAGVAFRTSYDDSFHHFAIPNVASTTYRLAALTVGPVVAFDNTATWGRLSIQLSAPAVGLIDHPNSDVKIGSAGLHPKFEGANTFRAGDADIALTSVNPGRMHVRAALHAGALVYRDYQASRQLRNTLSIGFVLEQRGVLR